MKYYKTAIITAAASATLAFSADAQNLLLNGSFEAPSLPSNSVQLLAPASWSSVADLFNGNNNGYYNAVWPTAQDGQQFVGLQGSLSQSFTVTHPGAYQLSWFESIGWTASLPGASWYSVTVTDSAHNVIALASLRDNQPLIWQNAMLPLDLSAGSYTLTLTDNGGVNNYSALFDNISITPVPEPSIVAFGLLGVVGFVVRRNYVRKA